MSNDQPHPDGLKEQFFKTAKVSINYAFSEKQGLPLLLLHGVTSNWQSFMSLIPVLAENYRIYALDLRGHGDSGRVRQGYRLVDYSTDVLQFIHDRVGQSTVILGHSFGALIALYVAAKIPQSIRGIILLDPPLIYRTLALKDSPWPVDQEAYRWFVRAYAIMRSSKSVRDIENSLQNLFPSWPEENRHALAQRLNQTDPDVLEMLISHQHMENYDPDELLGQVICPVLVFQGNRSRGAALTDEDAAYLLKKLEHCMLIRLEDAGHNIHETHSGKILEQVLRFLATISNQAS